MRIGTPPPAEAADPGFNAGTPPPLQRARVSSAELANRLGRLSLIMDEQSIRMRRSSAETAVDDRLSEPGYAAVSLLARTSGAFDLGMEDLDFVRRLGQGGFATVDLCRVRARDGDAEGAFVEGELVAIKRMHIGRRPFLYSTRVTPPSAPSALDLTTFLAEGALLRMLRHPNVLVCYGAISSRRTTSPERRSDASAPSEHALLLEYAEGGSLADRLRQRDYDARTAIGWLLGIARGMRFLHSVADITVLHRDLKPDNVLLRADGTAVISDFGLFRITRTSGSCDRGQRTPPAASTPRSWQQPPSSSRPASHASSPPTGKGGLAAFPFASPFAAPARSPPERARPSEHAHAHGPLEQPSVPMTGKTGTSYFIAPENFARDEHYTAAVDVFSFGMLAWEVLMQKTAYRALRNVSQRRVAGLVHTQRLRPAVPRRWPAAIATLVAACWDEEPSKRPPFDEVAARLERFQQDAELDGALYSALGVRPRPRGRVRLGLWPPACAAACRQ